MPAHDAAIPDAYAAAVARAGSAALAALEAVERAQRALHPARMEALRARLHPLVPGVEGALAALRSEAPPERLASFHESLAEGAERALAALRSLASPPEEPGQAVPRILEALSAHARAQERLYPLRRALPPLGAFFVEAPFRERAAELEAPEGAEGLGGLFHAGEGEEGRGGFALYVPEWLEGRRPRPLVVALHGAWGCGRDFLWTWLREARGRGCLLLAPTSRGSTWSLDRPGDDGARVRAAVERVAREWPVDRRRVLGTGLSDGGTFALTLAAAGEVELPAIAPVAGTLHPAALARGARAWRGRRVHWVHGAQDPLFPAPLARAACERLEEAGARVEYHELPDLAHAYPREANDAILRWLDPRLALP